MGGGVDVDLEPTPRPSELLAGRFLQRGVAVDAQGFFHQRPGDMVVAIDAQLATGVIMLPRRPLRSVSVSCLVAKPVSPARASIARQLQHGNEVEIELMGGTWAFGQEGLRQRAGVDHRSEVGAVDGVQLAAFGPSIRSNSRGKPSHRKSAGNRGNVENPPHFGVQRVSVVKGLVLPVHRMTDRGVKLPSRMASSSRR